MAEGCWVGGGQTQLFYAPVFSAVESGSKLWDLLDARIGDSKARQRWCFSGCMWVKMCLCETPVDAEDDGLGS